MYVFYDDGGRDLNRRRSEYQVIGKIERGSKDYVVTIEARDVNYYRDEKKVRMKVAGIRTITYSFRNRAPTVISGLMKTVRSHLRLRSKILEERVAPFIMAFVDPKLLSLANANAPLDDCKSSDITQ